MKELLKIAVIFAFLLIAIPALTFLTPENDGNGRKLQKLSENASAESANVGKSASFPETLAETVKTAQAKPGNQETGSETAEIKSGENSKTEDILKVLDFTSGQVMELPMREYVIGAVLAEMPATYRTEALKAQAVAARTYAVRQREKQRISPEPELMGADISNDSSKYQAYFTPEQAKRFYGSGYDSYLKKAEEAVDSTDRMIMVFDGEPIVAAFQSLSGGRTESAEIVWGSPVDYLVPVVSSDDENAPSYLEEKNFSADELRKILEKAIPEGDFSVSESKWISVSETSASGTVTRMTAGGKEISGADFRSILSLRSANFTVEYDSGRFSITTRGYGHGVGMSQYGANAMAESGSDFEEILTHYYTGAVLEKY